jgi:hypothetical protein
MHFRVYALLKSARELSNSCPPNNLNKFHGNEDFIVPACLKVKPGSLHFDAKKNLCYTKVCIITKFVPVPVLESSKVVIVRTKLAETMTSGQLPRGEYVQNL